MNASYVEYLKEYKAWEYEPSDTASGEILNFLGLEHYIKSKYIEYAIDNSLSQTTIIDANIPVNRYKQFKSFTLTPALLYELCPRDHHSYNLRIVDEMMQRKTKLVLPSFTKCRQCTGMIRSLDDLFPYAKEKADAEINHYFHSLDPNYLSVSYFSKNDDDKSNALSFTFVDNINEALEDVQYFCTKRNGRYYGDAKLIRVLSDDNTLHELLTRDKQLAISICANTLRKLTFKNNID